MNKPDQDRWPHICRGEISYYWQDFGKRIEVRVRQPDDISHAAVLLVKPSSPILSILEMAFDHLEARAMAWAEKQEAGA